MLGPATWRVLEGARPTSYHADCSSITVSAVSEPSRRRLLSWCCGRTACGGHSPATNHSDSEHSAQTGFDFASGGWFRRDDDSLGSQDDVYAG